MVSSRFNIAVASANFPPGHSILVNRQTICLGLGPPQRNRRATLHPSKNVTWFRRHFTNTKHSSIDCTHNFCSKFWVDYKFVVKRLTFVLNKLWEVISSDVMFPKDSIKSNQIKSRTIFRELFSEILVTSVCKVINVPSNLLG